MEYVRTDIGARSIRLSHPLPEESLPTNSRVGRVGSFDSNGRTIEVGRTYGVHTEPSLEEPNRTRTR